MKRLAILLLLCLPVFNCAVINQYNRYTTNFLEENLTPETKAGKVAFAPIAFPMALTALTIDGALIRPVVSIPDSFDAAMFAFEIESTGIFEIIVFPMRLVTFTAIFIVVEIAHITIPF